MNMYLKYRISITLVGLALLANPLVVPALAQQQVTPNSTPQPTTSATDTDDTLPINEEEEAQQELSASDEELEQLLNEDVIEEVPLTEEELRVESQDTSGATAPAAGATAINYRERAVRAALRQAGYKETPVNCNKFSRYFGRGCQKWCADFVSWAFDSTGNKDKKLPWKNPSAVASILAWAKNTNHLLKRTDKPQRGDIFLIRKIKNGKVLASHTGLIVSVSSDGKTFVTVEGNTSNKVMKRRLRSSNYQFVRVPNKAL
jgi:hypothetical protein